MILDKYERRARLTPGLLLTAPVVVIALSIGLATNPVVSVAIGLITAGVGGYLLSLLVAASGRRIQADLWESWGGPPTVQLLRARSTVSTKAQNTVWRSAVEALTGIGLLNARQEASNAAKADELIGAAIGQVRHLGQDARYPLVAAENAQYGLERNLFGSRWVGRILSVLGTSIVAFALLVEPAPNVQLLVALVAEAALVLVWVFVPSRERARSAAFRYAEQLLHAVTLESKSVNPPSGGHQ